MYEDIVLPLHTMGYKSFISKPYCNFISRDIKQYSKNAVKDQKKILAHLVSKARNTQFGKDHQFSEITDHKTFAERIPLRDYEGLRPYVDMILQGNADVLWPGRPKYFAKTSGTTSGVKYIPLTSDSMPNHMRTATSAFLNYASRAGIEKVLDGKVLFLSGSPEMETKSNIPTGRLSGIVNHEIPAWLSSNKLPGYDINCIESWEEKLEAIVKDTKDKDMRLISGIPPWVQMYFERLIEVTGKKSVIEIFPNLQIFMYGGVNYEPYRDTIETLIGKRLPSLETYPASEGFIAFQDQVENEGLLLNTRSGIFFEFVPTDQIHNEHPDRLGLEEVELNKDYAIIINNNAGLWGYIIGDSVRFVSLDPYRIVVSGRIKHFISAFGEHVIGKEIEDSMLDACQKHKSKVVEYTVAPQVNPADGSTPYHEWFVEFAEEPNDLEAFQSDLDNALSTKNIYYQDLIEGKVLQPLKLRKMETDSFRKYMKSQGKLGGQNKVPRLSNDRKIADYLTPLIKK